MATFLASKYPNKAAPRSQKTLNLIESFVLCGFIGILGSEESGQVLVNVLLELNCHVKHPLQCCLFTAKSGAPRSQKSLNLIESLYLCAFIGVLVLEFVDQIIIQVFIMIYMDAKDRLQRRLFTALLLGH